MVHGSAKNLQRRVIGWSLAILFVASAGVLALHYAIRRSPVRFQREAVATNVLGSNIPWRYMDEGKDPSIGKVWTTLNYDASFWKIGCGSFGTGRNTSADNVLKSGSETSADIYSYFFRYEFELEKDQVARIKSITGELSYKDAVVVYLNGEIIFTGNIPPGGYQTNLEAGASEEREDISVRSFQVAQPDALRSGRNVLSVEIHQGGAEGRDIYFAFHSLVLSEDNVRETDEHGRSLVLSKGRRDDSLTVNYVTDSEAPYRVEYMEAAAYHGPDDFSKYAGIAYMGCRAVAGSYLHQVELAHLKENTDYVYRMIRVGAGRGSETHHFSTGKNYQAKFGVVALPDGRASWNETMAGWQKADGMDFLAVIAGQAQDAEKEDAFLSGSSHWQETPIIFTGTGSSEETPLLNMIFGQENFYLTDRDITVIGIQEPDGAPSYIRQVNQTTKRAWAVVLTNTSGDAEALLDAGASLVFQGTGAGFQVCWKERGKFTSRQASCAEVIGHDNRLELTGYGQSDGAGFHAMLK